MLEQACDAADDVGPRARDPDPPDRRADARVGVDRRALSRGRRRRRRRVARLVRAPQRPAARSRQPRGGARHGDRARRASCPQVAALLGPRRGARARTLSRPDDVAALYAEVLSRAAPAASRRWPSASAPCSSTRSGSTTRPGSCASSSACSSSIRPPTGRSIASSWCSTRPSAGTTSSPSTTAPSIRRTGEKRTTLLEDAAQTAKDFADRPGSRHPVPRAAAGAPSPATRSSPARSSGSTSARAGIASSSRCSSARLPSLQPDEARRTRARVAALWLDELGEAAAALETIEPLARPRRAPERTASRRRCGPCSSGSWRRRPRRPSRADRRCRRAATARRARSGPASRRPPSSSRGSVRQRAAAWLRDHYAATGRDADLARMLLVELETVRSTKERVRRHLQVADLYEKLGDLANALEQTGLAVVLAPDDEARRAKLVELAERTGRLDRLADLLSAAAEVGGGAVPPDRAHDAGRRACAPIGSATPRAASRSSRRSSRRGVPDEAVLAAARKLEPLLEADGPRRGAPRRRRAHRERRERPGGAKRDAARPRGATWRRSWGSTRAAIALWETRVTGRRARRRGARRPRRPARSRGRQRDGPRRCSRCERARRRRRAPAGRSRAPRRSSWATSSAGPEDAIDAWRGIERDFGEADDAALRPRALLR